MDKVLRFFRTVAWGTVGLVFVTAVAVPALNAANVGDWPGFQAAIVVGALTVLGAGVLAVIMALIPRLSTNSPLARAVAQFLQTVAAGIPAPFLAEQLTETVVNYGRAWWALLLVALTSAVQAYIVNRREAPLVPGPVVNPDPVAPAIGD